MEKRSRRQRRALSREELLIYVVDPYAPGARRFVPAVRELMLAVGDELPVEVVTTGDHHRLPLARALCNGLRPDVLSEPLAEAARASRFTIDSRSAGAGIVALLALPELTATTVVEDVVRAFADDGRDIADADEVAAIARLRGGDDEATRVFAASAEALRMAEEDRTFARELGDPEGAALFYGAGRRISRLPGPGATPRELVTALIQVRPTR